MKILVFGHSGQVATELRALDGVGIRIIALDRTAANLTDPAVCAAAIDDHAPDASSTPLPTPPWTRPKAMLRWPI